MVCGGSRGDHLHQVTDIGRARVREYVASSGVCSELLLTLKEWHMIEE